MIGRSRLVGKPLAQLLLARHATVTMCHTRTRDLAAHTRRADILCVAAGRPRMVTGDMVKPGAWVIDVGVNRLDTGKLAGDVDFDAVSARGRRDHAGAGRRRSDDRRDAHAQHPARGHPPGRRRSLIPGAGPQRTSVGGGLDGPLRFLPQKTDCAGKARARTRPILAQRVSVVSAERSVLTVSALSQQLSAVIEERFPAVWVEGEISNFNVYGSGHAYFTLKDAEAQLRCGALPDPGAPGALRAADGLHVLAFGASRSTRSAASTSWSSSCSSRGGWARSSSPSSSSRPDWRPRACSTRRRKRPLPRFPAPHRHRDLARAAPRCATCCGSSAGASARLHDRHRARPGCRATARRRRSPRGSRELNALGDVDVIIVRPRRRLARRPLGVQRGGGGPGHRRPPRCR